ncbi:MAG: DinB family protein, partial [Sphingobacteriales bacterium]
MSAQTQQWFQKIDNLTKEFKERFGEMESDELNQKPNAQTWSIAENLQHLITV